MEKAAKLLDGSGKLARGKTKFLYFLNNGVVNSMLGNFDLSNQYFEKAYIYGEDYQKNYLLEGAAYLTNPTIIEYKGEDHEHLLLLYYKALNFLKLKNYSAALVECRRMINRLHELSDKYRSSKKYKRDAFIHNLIGIIFEASGDINNAFVAYRNAIEAYESDYAQLFGLSVPKQLQKDVIRTAHLMGFRNQRETFEKKFNLPYSSSWHHDEELLFFLNNGLGPVKSEWSINFAIIQKGGGVVFANEELG